jgi:inorganic triphosphatase YgiF
MTAPHETEIKLAASPAMLVELRKHPQLAGTDRLSEQKTTYFDTPGGRLWRGGAALRVRADGEVCEQTLKLGGVGAKVIRRQEWNALISGERPDTSEFPTEARAALEKLLDGVPLDRIGTTTIKRTARQVQYGDTVIEVVFDLGKIEAGSREEVVSEIEFELVDGQIADLMALALELPLGSDLAWSVRSKGERCHDLAFDLSPTAVRAEKIKLSQAGDVGRGFQAIAWSCLGQLLANYPLVVASGDPEAVHQARVAVRRLRAAFSLFGKAIDDEVAPILRAALKAVANGLAPARDLHVLIEQVASHRPDGDPEWLELEDLLVASKDDAVREAQAMLKSPQFQRLLFEIAGWIEGGDWLAHNRETARDKPLMPFARSVLSRRCRKLGKYSGRLLELSDAGRHRLRIAAKKLRYAAEFFASLDHGKSVTKRRVMFVSALAHLQDTLGKLNDIAVASAKMHGWFDKVAPITAARMEALLEEMLATRRKSRRKLIKKAEKSLDEMKRSSGWWGGS